MATFTWAAAASGPWDSAAFWSIDGSPANAVPGMDDTALIDAVGTYTVTATFGSEMSGGDVASLTIGDPSATLLTVGTGLGVVGSLSGGQFVNDGTIIVPSAGGGSPTEGLFIGSELRPDLVSYANPGTIELSAGATLGLGVDLSTAALGNIESDGGVLALLGTLDNTGSVFSVSGYDNVVLDGTVLGGVFRDDGGTLTLAGTLDDLVFQGDAPLQGGFTVANSVTFESLAGVVGGTVDVSFASGPLSDNGAVTLDNVTLQLADGGRIGVGGTLTLGAHSAVISTAAGTFENSATHVIALGTMTNTGSLFVSGTNEGLISSSGAGNALSVSGLANSGQIAISDGVITFGSSDGSGTITLASGTTADVIGSYGQQVLGVIGTGNLLKFSYTGTSELLGFSPGNTIELVGSPAPDVMFSSTTLALADGSAPIATFVLPGVPANAQFQAVVDSNFNTFVTETLPCFAEGTSIAVGWSEKPVEWLRPGDRVRSAFGGTAPVIWVGHRRVQARHHRSPEMMWPVLIRAGALAPGVPRRDLRVSPEHALYLDGVLVPARYLLNGRSVVQMEVASITYWHVELPQHDVILAEDAACESYLDTGNRADFENSGVVVRAHPQFQIGDANEIWLARACAPQCRNGERLERIRRDLARRAGSVSHGDKARRAASNG